MTPDALPVLSAGPHPADPTKKCAMEAASWLAGHPEQGDAPDCVHSLLQWVFFGVNDQMPDEDRHRLWPLIFRAMGTYPNGLTPAEDVVVCVRLALWATRRAPLTQSASALLDMVEAWCDGRRSMDDADVDAGRILGPPWYNLLVRVSESSDHPTPYSAHKVAGAAAMVVNRTAVRGPGADHALSDLLDEYDRLTGHTPPAPEPDKIRDLGLLVGTTQG